MKTILSAFKPTPLGILLILLALLFQAVFCSSSTSTFSRDSTEPDRSSLALGLGSPITVTTTNGKSNLSIKWVNLALNLAITHALSVLTGTGLAKITRLRRPTFAAGIVVGS